ncbi:MAG: RNA polymerase factor sigma-32, partial [Gammaproteobacteria bacterium]|nr:RNA polymerase factor sigma-32 [Gammaproteobacteria bacterium]
MSKSLQLQFAVPSGSLESYLSAARNIPILSAEEERELAVQLQEHGDLEAAQKLVLS